ncbi:hypothetical protein [Brevundimonas sp. NIBR11]|uniref:hypothetical protein n=1 Tax=Brevundimonas sp. NIBR11 TaxID=3015999 RepID=UPI0022F12C2A|nr:hypothetical protein [Brevundimonas sp. NIBR11]WGM31602.1 hypothetical protein KKHFBJBL_01849 [Brevundimonas sp. NIBR11]
MSHKDVGGRRLKLRIALGRTLAVLPLLWRRAAGALALCAAAWLVPAVWAPTGWMVWLWGLAAIVMTVLAVGALSRLAISDDLGGARRLGLGPLGLQAGLPEARLIGAALLCLLFLAMIVCILALVVLAVFGMAELNVQAIQVRDWAAVGEPWKLGVLAALGLGAVAVPLLLIVRLSLFAPATLGRRQMVSLNSMGIAYGSFWQILAGLIVTALPKIVLLVLMGTGLLVGKAGQVVCVLGLVGLQLPLTLGFLGAAYRQLEYWSPEEPKR